LCLLVVFNAPLIVAWLNTLNNQSLFTNLPAKEYNKERCWKPKRGLRVWDVTSQGIPPMNADGLIKNVDVVLITASALQVDPGRCWMTKVKWHTVLADEGHDYLRGQHNARPGTQSLTLQNWGIL
jgi:hypothetical protein